MARKKYDGKTRWVPVHTSLALGALAVKDVISQAAVNAAVDTYRLIGFKGSFSVEDLGADEGPVIAGIADGDYTAAEIEECLEAANSMVLGDRVTQEQANRLVRQCATLIGDVHEIKDEQWYKLNWLVSIGKQPQLYAYNADPDNPLTTGATLHMDGKILIRFC